MEAEKSDVLKFWFVCEKEKRVRALEILNGIVRKGSERLPIWDIRVGWEEIHRFDEEDKEIVDLKANVCGYCLRSVSWNIVEALSDERIAGFGRGFFEQVHFMEMRRINFYKFD